MKITRMFLPLVAEVGDKKIPKEYLVCTSLHMCTLSYFLETNVVFTIVSVKKMTVLEKKLDVQRLLHLYSKSHIRVYSIFKNG